MPGRFTIVRHQPSITVAAVLWTGALCSAWHDDDRDEAVDNLILAAAMTGALVAAILHGRNRDLAEAHWAGYHAGLSIGRRDEAG